MEKSIASKMNSCRRMLSRHKNDVFKFKHKKKRKG